MVTRPAVYDFFTTHAQRAAGPTLAAGIGGCSPMPAGLRVQAPDRGAQPPWLAM
jgi:hypothetical protein